MKPFVKKYFYLFNVVTIENYYYFFILFKQLSNLKKLDIYAKERNLPAYVPEKIGCNLANGDWNKIKDFIEKETDITIVSWK